jgi:hypothetical protein
MWKTWVTVLSFGGMSVAGVRAKNGASLHGEHEVARTRVTHQRCARKRLRCLTGRCPRTIFARLVRDVAVGLTMAERKALTRQMAKRYRAAGKADTTAMQRRAVCSHGLDPGSRTSGPSHRCVGGRCRSGARPTAQVLRRAGSGTAQDDLGDTEWPVGQASRSIHGRDR